MGPKSEEVQLESFSIERSSDAEKAPIEDIDEKEQIINAIGGWGKWQLRRCILITIIIWLPASFHLLNMVFYTDKTDFWCSRPENSSYSVEEWKELTHKKLPDSESNQTKYDACWVRDLSQEDEEVYVKCQEFEYDRSFWERTIIMDFNLVCERASYIKFNQQMTFFGLMCGVLASGLISDRFGRRPTMLVLLLTLVIAGTASSFTTNYPSFLVSVWFCGFSSIGYGTVMYCWMMEHISGNHKTVMGAVPHYCFGFWGLLTPVICYLVPNWRKLQLIFSIPCLTLSMAYLVIPESARWLLTNGKKKEAEDLCREIARANGRELGDNFELKMKSKSAENQRGSGFLGIFQLFKNSNLRQKTCICYFLWFATALTYYGLTLNSNSLGASVFVYTAIGKALEFPAITIVILMLLKTGRRLTLMVFYSMGGISLMLIIAVPLNTFPYEWPIVVLNLLGRVCAIGTLAVCYIYSSEIFPTVVRNVGLGSSSLWARVGPMVAPFVAMLAVYDERLPAIFFGVISLIAGFLVTFLPETSKTPLPDTIEESELQGEGDTFWRSIRKSK